MKERFSERARNAMALANLEAGKLKHDYIAPFHMMLGILAGGECVATAALLDLEVDLDDARCRVFDKIELGSADDSIGRRAQTREMTEVMGLALAEARKLEHRYVGTEHLMLALCEFERGIPARVLQEMGVEFGRLRSKILALLEASDGSTPVSERPRQADTG